jgi:four helix bundle protein
MEVTATVYFKFEKLIVWQKAMDWGEEIFKLSRSFPKHELFNLTSQICRAVDSVALNIAEGSIDQTNPEQARFLSYAIRSISEVVTCLYKAQRRNYITEIIFNDQYKKANELFRMLISLKNTIRQQTKDH